jgi:hypothetical protein
MQILNLYPEDFENPKTWRDVCDCLEIHPESTEASILFVRASSESIPQVNEIAIIWDINDVKSLDLELDDEQCREVLIRAKDKHDANQGINWNVLEHFAQLVRIESIEKGAW